MLPGEREGGVGLLLGSRDETDQSDHAGPTQSPGWNVCFRNLNVSKMMERWSIVHFPNSTNIWQRVRLTWTNSWLNSLLTLLNLMILNFKLFPTWNFPDSFTSHSTLWCGLVRLSSLKWVGEWGRDLVDGIEWNLVSGKVKIWKLDMVWSALLRAHLLSGSFVEIIMVF